MKYFYNEVKFASQSDQRIYETKKAEMNKIGKAIDIIVSLPASRERDVVLKSLGDFNNSVFEYIRKMIAAEQKKK